MQARPQQLSVLGASVVALCAAVAPSRAAEGADEEAARLAALQQQITVQTERLEALKRSVAQQEAILDDIRRALSVDVLAGQRGRAAPPRGPGAPLAEPTVAQAQAPQPVGQAPDRDARPVEVAPIFEQPGVLTPKGGLVLEPSLQYAYSASNRIALVGYTIIPAILVGLIDVREVKRNTFTATLTGRYGLTNRFEVEARLPYVHRSDSTVGREVLQGAATSSVFDASGTGIGDIEVTGRYQFNDGGADSPYYIGSLRVKSRTGKDPFEVETSTAIQGLREGVQTELPTGSGFYGVQPALTVLFPSDPVVFFGSVSYLYSLKRDNVTRRTSSGTESLGTIQPGGVFGFNFGMGLALNETSSFSVGYDHSSIGKTKLNGQATADSVRVQLGTLLLGYSYRLSPKHTLNVSLGAGLTVDTPDVTLTVRVPTSF